MLWPVVLGDEIAGIQVNTSEVKNRAWGNETPWGSAINPPLLSSDGSYLVAVA
jgi:hypothetical protein